MASISLNGLYRTGLHSTGRNTRKANISKPNVKPNMPGVEFAREVSSARRPSIGNLAPPEFAPPSWHAWTGCPRSAAARAQLTRM
jgi:hypothetical protein